MEVRDKVRFCGMACGVAARIGLCVAFVTEPVPVVAEEARAMDRGEDFGVISPRAPALGAFAFLLGRWRCDARLRAPDGAWRNFRATWVGRAILEGHAIADDYRMTDETGALVVLGMNIRSYDEAGRIWNIRWLDALTGTWFTLSPSELGGVTVADGSVVYAFREPVAGPGHVYTRVTYTSLDAARFTWRGEKSDDGQAWREFMIVGCDRDGT